MCIQSTVSPTQRRRPFLIRFQIGPKLGRGHTIEMMAVAQNRSHSNALETKTMVTMFISTPVHLPYTQKLPRRKWTQCPQRPPSRMTASPAAGDATTNKQSNVKWKCMSDCGACCKLDDFDEPVLREMLKDEKDVVEYLDMISPNGWCKWFDSFSRKCTRYDSRPRFCRATPEVFQQMYDVPVDEFDSFAMSCCDFHIGNSFGEQSQEFLRYQSFKALPSGHNQICEGGSD